MKRFDKKELQKQAAEIAKQHKVDTVLATEDGNYFLPNDKSLAKDHHYKNVRKQWENAELHEFDFSKKKNAEADDTSNDNIGGKSENELVAECAAKAKELSDSGVSNKNRLKAELKKAGFTPEIIALALTPVKTHEQ